MERLILCGGGHVSLEVAYMGARLGFEVVVIDDRVEFANSDRFPMAAQVLAMPFSQALEQLGSQPADYYVILTRGHAYDAKCLSQILKGSYAYVGMIGSRIKVAAVMQQMRQEGFSDALLAGVHSPVGLNIGAQSPAEIAVSILAEIVQERAKQGPGAIPPPDSEGVLVTIEKKSGSAPRGAGAWMHVQPDGTCTGTIGGGAVEYQARTDALELWRSKAAVMRKTYDLSHAAAELGMVCGGKIEVSFQKRGEKKMKEILMFVLKGCPHCKLALQLQEQLLEEHPEWREIPLRIVEEREEKQLADSYDYFYVPAYYVDGVKVHEGHAEREDVAAVFQAALGTGQTADV